VFLCTSGSFKAQPGTSQCKFASRGRRHIQSGSNTDDWCRKGSRFNDGYTQQLHEFSGDVLQARNCTQRIFGPWLPNSSGNNPGKGVQ
jgi:hypothetical protein